LTVYPRKLAKEKVIRAFKESVGLIPHASDLDSGLQELESILWVGDPAP